MQFECGLVAVDSGARFGICGWRRTNCIGIATDYALPFIPQLDRHDFAEARHELLHELPEVTDQLWASLLAFIEKNRAITDVAGF